MDIQNANGVKHFKKFCLYPIAYYNKIWQSFDMVFHSHSYYEIMYVEEGECDIKLYRFVSGKRLDEEIIHLTKDSAIFINSEIFHRLIVKNGAKILNIEFERRKSEDAVLHYDFSEVMQTSDNLKKMFDSDSFFYVFHNANDIVSPLKKIQGELTLSLHTKNEREILFYAYITELFIKIGKVWESNRVNQGIIYVKKTIKYINEHFTEELTAAKIAAHLKISKGYLHKLIKQETGKTLVGVVNEFRINRALQLLQSTQLPIIDIAIECGFNNRQNFHYVFRKIIGKSAGEFRTDEYAADTYSFGEDYMSILQDKEEERYEVKPTQFIERKTQK